MPPSRHPYDLLYSLYTLLCHLLDTPMTPYAGANEVAFRDERWCRSAMLNPTVVLNLGYSTMPAGCPNKMASLERWTW